HGRSGEGAAGTPCVAPLSEREVLRRDPHTSRAPPHMLRRDRKEAMHARNRFRGGYDFLQLAAVSPSMGAFVRPNVYGDLSIDYANAEAVNALNRALLTQAYGLSGWDVPPGYLCPPIPGRSDHLHHLAD